jgi:hypothetical protein
MKYLSTHGQPRFQSSSSRFLLLAAALLIVAGCGKKAVPETTAVSTPTETAPVSTPAPENHSTPVYNAPPASAPTVASASTGGADLKQLNHIYIGWVIQNRRRAKSFEEFVAASGVQVPPAPDGKKYVIDGNGFINLASR